MNFLDVLISFSSFSFIVYGILCLSSVSMKSEFKRFGLENLRMLTGILELFGGIGLLIGFIIPSILLVSSGGLALLMLFGFGVRLKIKDGILRSSPAFLLMILNIYIFVQVFKL